MNQLHNGEHPKFPLRVLKSKDPVIIAIVHAIKGCWTYDPNEWPTSQQIRDFLNDVLRNILGIEELGIVWVLVPPLPASHSYSGSDFYENLLW